MVLTKHTPKFYFDLSFLLCTRLPSFLPSPSPSASKKWPILIFSMALSVLTSERPTRTSQSLPSHFTYHVWYSCVGVWQNDRVEIIANDRACLFTFYVVETFLNV